LKIYKIAKENATKIDFKGASKDPVGFYYADFDIDNKHWRYILNSQAAQKLEFIVGKGGPYKAIAYVHKNKMAEFQIDEQFQAIEGTYKEF